MSDVRRRLSWWVHGHRQMDDQLARLGADLRDLQLKVAALDARIGGWEHGLIEAKQSQLDGIAVLREAVNACTDDLTGRYVALEQRVTQPDGQGSVG